MNRKVLLLLSLLNSLLITLSASAQTGPLWYVDLEKAYPRADFVAFVGSGTDVDTARQDSLGQVSLYLGSQVTASVDGYKLVQTSKSSSQNESRFEAQIREKVSTTSRHTVVGLQFSPEFRPGDGTVALVAYWNRVQASRQFADQITQLLAQIESLLASQSNKTSLESWLAARKALAGGEELRDLDRIRRLLSPGSGSLVPTELQTRLDGLTATDLRPTADLRLEGEPEGRVAEALKQSLTQFGFVLKAEAPLVIRAKTSYEALAGSGNLAEGRGRLEVGFTEGPGELLSITLESRAVGTTPASARNRTFNDLLNKIKLQLPPSIVQSLEKYLR